MYILPIAKNGDKITRNELGKKVIGTKLAASYLNNWESLVVDVNAEKIKDYDNQPYLIHCGKSNIVAIDFDSDLFMDAIKLNESLPKEQQCTNISQSIGKKGGHFIYRYSDNDLTKYINNPNGKRKYGLDTLYGNSLVFASNKANTTKEQLISSNEFIEIPLAMQLLLMNHYLINSKDVISSSYQTSYTTGSKLGYLAESAINSDEHMFKLLGCIMTKEYKAMLESSVKSHLPNYHPDRLPDDESGHMFILSLANVLRLDVSIDTNTYTGLILKINSMFSQPLDESKVRATIIKQDLQKFVYDKDWKQKSIVVMTKDNEPLEIFKYNESGRNKFIVYNGVTHEIIQYDAISSVLEYIASMTMTKNLRKEVVIDRAMHVKIIDRPDLPFGFIKDDGIERNRFNLYKWNEVQEVFYNPILHKNKYKEPKTILNAISSAVSEETRDTLFLPFLKRKFMTRDHSALFFVFYGVPHSFKSGMFNGIISHFCPRRNKKLSLSILTDKYNDWQINSDFILLDEIHHYLSNELTQLIKSVNEVTGNKTIAGVRGMHKSLDAAVYPQEMTIMMTTNETVQLTTEARDRRMVVFKSSQRLSDALNLSNVVIEKNINNEILDFAYYLATEVKELEGDAYITNEAWRSSAYYDFIEDGLPAVDKIAKYIDTEALEDLFAFIVESELTTKEHIEKCMYRNERTKLTQIRLFNSREDLASYPALFNAESINIKKLRQKIKLCNNIKYDLVEYEDGSSVRTGSKKTDLVITKIPDGYNMYTGIEPIENSENINID